MPPQVFISPQASKRGSHTDSDGSGGGGSGSAPGKRFCSRGSSGTKPRRPRPAERKGGCEWGLSLSLNAACDLSHPERRSDKWLIPESPLAWCPLHTPPEPPPFYTPLPPSHCHDNWRGISSRNNLIGSFPPPFSELGRSSRLLSGKVGPILLGYRKKGTIWGGGGVALFLRK